MSLATPPFLIGWTSSSRTYQAALTQMILSNDNLMLFYIICPGYGPPFEQATVNDKYVIRTIIILCLNSL